MKTETIAVYAGSFDLLTNGHVWVADTAAGMFDRLIVAIGVNSKKRPMFVLDERIEMLKQCLGHHANVKIDDFSEELLVRYASRVGASYIVRGIRNPNDFVFEMGMRHANADIAPNIQTCFLIPPLQLLNVSSSMVKEFYGYKGWEEDVARYVPLPVLEKLKEHHHGMVH